MNNTQAIIRQLKERNYAPIWQQMQQITNTRDADMTDEIWLVEHNPVFTQGLAGKKEHILNPGDIPVVQTDRGGQVTYHGPGQLVVYFLIDIKRKQLGIRSLVCLLEQSVIDYLATFGVKANGKREAPGVYVNDKKICSIGLRIRRGCSYHGIAFNIDMDLEPFSRINPCGFQNLQMTQLAEFTGAKTVAEAGDEFMPHLLKNLAVTETVRG